MTISAIPRSRIDAAKCEDGEQFRSVRAKRSCEPKWAARFFHDQNAAVRSADQAACLIQRGLADGGEVQQSGELFRELLDQVDFPVKVQHFGGKRAAFGFLGREMRKQRGDCGSGGSDGPVTQPSVVSSKVTGNARSARGDDRRAALSRWRPRCQYPPPMAVDERP